MPDYRLYCRRRDGQFTKAHGIAAADDDDAIAKAKRMKIDVKCELWERARLVAELPPHFS
jgi:hypothetical protein